ncbi:MAG: LL-diaminopimelate aminotransferase [Clostridiaceae bacterium]|nr:LL-diaminopimelate aminotransferase [Clostridiaceae bacterium]
MIRQGFRNIQESYLFSEIGARVRAYQAAHPEREILRMGIGDVTRPLPKAAADAMEKASREMGSAAGFHGYGDEQGYAFLREAIAGYYAGKGVRVDSNEVFVSDGAKSDLGNLLDLFSDDCTVLIPNPTYPVYVDTNVMAGRKVLFYEGKGDNGFTPLPDESVHADVIYICSPNNPTGAVYTKEALEKWVEYANREDAVILFDAAYEAFVKDTALPSSILGIDGARTCAIEVCSLSKTAGFTGTRCGYTVVPAELIRDGCSLRKLWLRRQTTKFNGVSYIVQRGAEAVFTGAGLREARENITYYLENAAILGNALRRAGISYVGGENSPYLWLRCPDGEKSWDFFDRLLNERGIVGTPGAGFGSAGEGWFRFTAFAGRESIQKAAVLLTK